MNDLTHSRRLIITITVSLLAGMELLDSTVVNVSLPNMMGALSANSEQISWVLTSYIVASSIMMPLTGFLVKNIGQKRFMLIIASGFLMASMACGLSTSMSQIVVFRIIQGLCGASFVPISQLILLEIYPFEERAKAMAIWGLGLMVAPTLGPTVGGYITEYINWRWVFYINVPICLMCLSLIYYFIPESVKEVKKIDWSGLILMAIGVGCLQTFLDQGNQKDWFSSGLIIFLAITSAIAITIFIIRGLMVKDNIVNLRLFKNRNFALGCFMFMLFIAAVLGPIAIMPLMFQYLFNYPTVLNGLIVMPNGVASAVSMALAPLLMRIFGNKPVMIMGIFLGFIGVYLMSQYDLYIDVKAAIMPGIWRGLGMGLFLVPLGVETFATLDRKLTAEASGLYSFCRMLGNALGISILNTILTRETQINWNRLGSKITAFKFSHLNPEAIHMLGNELHRQASMVAFIDCYWIDAMAFLLLIPLVFILAKSKTTSGGENNGAH
ncbi:MAG: DHA2 family efflux MFS transporter permease subunit [Gammaproteobacteria bacterium]|nr:DHA2 family efflux MFS transporter permease subunit [Gammaproteobacteria bacterium]